MLLHLIAILHLLPSFLKEFSFSKNIKEILAFPAIQLFVLYDQGNDV